MLREMVLIYLIGQGQVHRVWPEKIRYSPFCNLVLELSGQCFKKNSNRSLASNFKNQKHLVMKL